jgi:hypothetical protein
MDNITTFEPDNLCYQLFDKLIPFFQTVDLELPTTEIVKNFLAFITVNGMSIIGRTCTITLEDANNISPEVLASLDEWKQSWGKDFMEPLTIIHDKKVSFYFPPVCEHMIDIKTC